MLQPKVKVQPALKRAKNFREVAAGFTKRIAAEEARRCPQCTDAVCHRACPLGVDIPGFIRLLREGAVAGALNLIREQNSLPGICGRVCLAPCEDACILRKDGDPIAIRVLERFAADHGRRRFASPLPRPTPEGKKVAVIGSGPAGLTAAARLAESGFRVTVFEAFPFLGGILRYGIPELRLPNRVIDREVAQIKGLGVEFKTNTRFGLTVTLPQLWDQDFAAVLLATGTGGGELSRLPGSLAGGVYLAEEFLLKMNTADPRNSRRDLDLRRGRRAAVLGAGNKALDCARMCVRLGKQTSLIFSSTEDECDVHPHDLRQAQDEGVTLLPLTRVKEIAVDPSHFASGLRCDRLDFADPTGKGQWQLIPVPDSDFVQEADMVILAVGHRPNTALIRALPGLRTASSGVLSCDEGTMQTAVPRVFACGDLVHGRYHVVEAMASGKKAAAAIQQFLQKT